MLSQVRSRAQHRLSQCRAREPSPTFCSRCDLTSLLLLLTCSTNAQGAEKIVPVCSRLSAEPYPHSLRCVPYKQKHVTWSWLIWRLTEYFSVQGFSRDASFGCPFVDGWRSIATLRIYCRCVRHIGEPVAPVERESQPQRAKRV
jgi:hypothetical protein